MSTGGMMSGPGGKGGPPSSGTGGFMGGPGGPQPGGGGMGAGGFMAGGGKGGSPGGMGAGGFMANNMAGPQGAQAGGFMGQGGPQGPGAGQGGYMQTDAYDQNAAGYAGQMGSPLMSNAFGVAAIEKRLEWRMLFFVGALCVFVSGIVSIFHFVISFGDVSHWSPCTFLSCCFLLIFGVLMIALDFPANPPPQMQHIIMNIYTFALFLTRFTGRGIWYVFLGTHTWVALYDDSINSFFGIVFTLYLVLLGIAAAAKGMFLSYRLHRVQLDLTDKRVQPQQFMTQQMGMQKAEFKQMCTSVMPANEAQFTEAEYGYIVNALNFKPRNDGMVTTEELDYWLQKGPMLLV